MFLTILISALSFNNALDCKKFIYENERDKNHLVFCESDWNKVMKGIYFEKCENGIVVFETPISKEAPKYFVKNLDNSNVSCNNTK